MVTTVNPADQKARISRIQGPRATCIYCLESKSSEEFNRDHVLPELLGRFRNNLVLHGMVCRDCNGELGRQAEIVLGRGSFEGYVRHDQGIKGTRSTRKFMRNRVPIRLASGSARAGLRVDIVVDRGKLRCRAVPQISVQHSLEPAPRYFTEEQFLALSEEEIVGREIHVITAEGGLEHDNLVAVVKQRLPDFELPPMSTEKQPPPTALEFDQRLDHALARAIAKIGFNYLAFVAGPNFIHQAHFNPVRRFIRWSEGPPDEFVRIDDEPILAEEAPHRRLQRNHLLTLQWEGTKRHGQDWIQARIAPFNMLTYHVRLCHGFTGVWREINSGHRFDLDARQVYALRPYSKSLLP